VFSLRSRHRRLSLAATTMSAFPTRCPCGSVSPEPWGRAGRFISPSRRRSRDPAHGALTQRRLRLRSSPARQPGQEGERISNARISRRSFSTSLRGRGTLSCSRFHPRFSAERTAGDFAKNAAGALMSSLRITLTRSFPTPAGRRFAISKAEIAPALVVCIADGRPKAETVPLPHRQASRSAQGCSAYRCWLPKLRIASHSPSCLPVLR
jgi:hypothetical protein